MSLDWNVSGIIDRKGKEFVWHPAEDDTVRLDGITDCLIWATMFIGMNEITEDNALEFADRLYIYEMVAGNISSRNTPITHEEVFDRIGLYTNASKITKAAFKTKIMKILAERAVLARDGNRPH